MRAMFRLTTKPARALALLLVPVILVLVYFSITRSHGPPVSRRAEQSAGKLDQHLQSVATAALGEREGAIVILDPQTGRLRALVNPKLAYQQVSSPGSTIKPFTALAALRNNTIGPDTRMRCREHKRKDVVPACSHPTNLAPFDPAEALAYSCNYYFATVGEQLDQRSFARLLTEFGFGEPTGIGDAKELSGGVVSDRWQPESAIGEGEFLQVTPLQLAMAYAALLNGGKLFRPTTSFTPSLRAQLSISDDERKVLIEGMRGAVTFGTAEKADLDSLPAYVVGKTGTSTPLQGFRSQGWFAGVVFESSTRREAENAQLLIVVYLQNSRGADAAEVARVIFEELTGSSHPTSETTYVSVHQVAKNSTRKLRLEDYVVQVVSTEASVEDEPEALKALAVAARTYTLKNLGRHKNEGYDFCSTTHCQRFQKVVPRRALLAAVKETSGMVLRDDQGQIIDAYFSASCGGMTANINTLWGVDAPEYLRGVRDDYCQSGSHYRWSDVITSQQLASALRSDARTDVGQTIRDLAITKYDETGRAESISISGDRTRAISGWEFKLIIGRALGWNVLKSSRFDVSRVGSQFVFRGGGFGHGLGLCQEGSHVMAQRGHSFQQILAHYYPGASVRYS
jgi:SpoIID/LytB domain protein